MAPRTPKSSPGSALKSSQTLADLRSVASDFGLDTSGRKADLIERIKEHENGAAPSLVKRLGGYNRDFEGMDQNDDGRVTRSEVDAHNSKLKAKGPGSALKRLQSDRGYKDHQEDITDTMDTNHDGRVLRSESKPSRDMTVAKMKTKLLEMGLSTTGLKNELLARLQDALDKISGSMGSPAGSPAPEASDDADAVPDNKSQKESEMGEVVASDASNGSTFFPVFVGFAVILAIIAWHLNNLQNATAAK